MKNRWITALLLVAVLTIFIYGGDEPRALRECKASLEKIKKDIQEIEKKLDNVNKKIRDRGARINEFSPVYDRLHKPIKLAQKQLKKIKKDLSEARRRSRGLGGDDTLLNRVVKKLDGTSADVKRLEDQEEEKDDEIDSLSLKADREVKRKFQHLKNPPHDLDTLESKLKTLKINQDKDKKDQSKWTNKLASRKEDLEYKAKECTRLEKHFQALGGGGTGSAPGVVTFIGGTQIPTPKSGMDIHLVEEIDPVWPNYWEYFPLFQIDPADTRTKTYYETLRKDMGDAILEMDESGNKVTLSSMFEKSAEEYGKLLQLSEKPKREKNSDPKPTPWVGTPIQYYQGPYLVRIVCAGQTRYRFHYISADTKSTFGGIHLFGLAKGRHPVTVSIAAGNGEVYESQFEVFVHFEEQIGRKTEMGKDGVVREGVEVIVDLAYLKNQFNEMWAIHLRDRSQTLGKPDLRLSTLKSDIGLVQNYIIWMKKKPGCTAADLAPLLAKGAEAASLLLSEYGSDKTTSTTKDTKITNPAYNPTWWSFLTMARICDETGTTEAYNVLAPLAQKAAGIATKDHMGTVAHAFTYLGNIALMRGEFDKAVNDLTTALFYRKRAKPDLDVNKEKKGLPRKEQLKAMAAMLDY